MGESNRSMPGEAIPPVSGTTIPRVEAAGGSAYKPRLGRTLYTGTYSELSEDHRDELIASAIPEEIAAARGYFSTISKSELQSRGASSNQVHLVTSLNPILGMPIYGYDGQQVALAIKAARPRIDQKTGKARKYEIGWGSRAVIDFSGHAKNREAIQSSVPPLWITEGVKKVDAQIGLGLCSIGLLGVWGWRGANSLKGFTRLPEWEYISLRDRKVYLTFDSDLLRNPQVSNALNRFKRFLESRGAEVFVIIMPLGPDGGKLGVDDYIAARLRGESL